jgi:hypothetical protein
VSCIKCFVSRFSSVYIYGGERYTWGYPEKFSEPGVPLMVVVRITHTTDSVSHLYHMHNLGQISPIAYIVPRVSHAYTVPTQYEIRGTNYASLTTWYELCIACSVARIMHFVLRGPRIAYAIVRYAYCIGMRIA